MPKLKAMLKQPGVLAVGRFSRKGLLEDVYGELSEEDASLAARMCDANAIASGVQGRLLSALTGWEEFADHIGWTMFGDELGLVAIEDMFCLIRLRDASLTETVRGMRQTAGLD